MAKKILAMHWSKWGWGRWLLCNLVVDWSISMSRSYVPLIAFLIRFFPFSNTFMYLQYSVVLFIHVSYKNKSRNNPEDIFCMVPFTIIFQYIQFIFQEIFWPAQTCGIIGQILCGSHKIRVTWQPWQYYSKTSTWEYGMR